MSERQEILHTHIGNMVALIKHISQAVERQAADEDVLAYPQARVMVQQLSVTLKEQVSRLQEHEKQQGGNSPLKEAAAAALGAAAGLYDQVRGYTASKALRDDYTALSLAAISYTMLYTTAKSVGANSTANVALTSLKEITPFVTEISKVICYVVARELDDEHEDTYVNTAVSQPAVEATQEAWNPKHVNSAAPA